MVLCGVMAGRGSGSGEAEAQNLAIVQATVVEGGSK